MSDSWVAWMWLPGTLLGVCVGLLGAYIGVQASRGQLRRSALGLMLAAAAVSVIFLLAGLVALAAGQPRGVWYGLLLPGAVVSATVGVNLPVVWKLLREQTAGGR